MAQAAQLSSFARALKRVLDDDTNTFGVPEIADVAECSKRHLYSAIDPDRSTCLSVEKAARISRYLSEHGEYRPAYAMLHPALRIVRAMEGEADGDATDDVMALIKAGTGLDDAYDNHNWAEAQRFLDDVRHQLNDLEAEVARAKGRQ